MKLRIGSVPYLNVKPLVDWFHQQACTEDIEIIYAVPSQLAMMLREGYLDAANVSIFEAFQNSRLQIVPNISISAIGRVKSVRLFSKSPLNCLKSVALDSSSLTSAALTKILLSEQFSVCPNYINYPPQLDKMLECCDAGLIIGDLNLFEDLQYKTVYDLGYGWWELTKLPFVYACWLVRDDSGSGNIVSLFHEAKHWGLMHLEDIAQKWSKDLKLPHENCSDYLINVMNYDLSPAHIEGLQLFQQKCFSHGLLSELFPLRFYHG